MSEAPAIEVRGLRKRYGSLVAVDGVSFEVAQGEIFGIVGPNGAGKTTTLECVEGLRRPDEGEVRILGVDPHREPPRLLPLIGVQLQQANLPDHLKVWEALDLFASFYPAPQDWRKLLERLGIADKRNAPFSRLSGGQKQRLLIALALVGDPRVLFLDELTTGLDPHARRAMWDEVRRIRDEGRTIVLTTHFMEEAERLCDRVAIMDRGRIVALDTPGRLVGQFGRGGRVRVRMDGGHPLPQTALQAIEQLGDVEKVELDGEWITVTGSGSRLVVQIVHVLDQHGVAVADVRSEQPTLDDVFVGLTGRRLADGESRPAGAEGAGVA